MRSRLSIQKLEHEQERHIQTHTHTQTERDAAERIASHICRWYQQLCNGSSASAVIAVDLSLRVHAFGCKSCKAPVKMRHRQLYPHDV